MSKQTTNWNVLYLDLSPKLLGICRRYVKDTATAEDIVQESFIVAIEKEHQLKNAKAIKGWMSKIVVNMALHHLKNEKKMPFTTSENYEFIAEAELMNTLELDKKSALLASDLDKNDILEAIDQLPEHHKAVFNLYVIDQFSHQEISSLLSISVGTSKSHLSRARKNMQDYLYQKLDVKTVDEKKKRRFAFLLFLGFGNMLFANFYKKPFQDFYIQPTKPFTTNLNVNSSNIPNQFIGFGKSFVSGKIVLGIASLLVVITSFLYWNTTKNETSNTHFKNEIKQVKNAVISLDSINYSKDVVVVAKDDFSPNKEKVFVCKKTKINKRENLIKSNSKSSVANFAVDSAKVEETPKVVVIKKQIIKRDTVYVTK